jgi:hypothetical protein
MGNVSAVTLLSRYFVEFLMKRKKQNERIKFNLDTQWNNWHKGRTLDRKLVGILRCL